MFYHFTATLSRIDETRQLIAFSHLHFICLLDINECKLTNDTLQYMSPPCGCRNSAHPCKATCVNTPGSYKCKCGKGFRLNGAEQCEGKAFILHKKWNRKLRIWSHLLKNFLVENFVYCAVSCVSIWQIIRVSLILKYLFRLYHCSFSWNYFSISNLNLILNIQHNTLVFTNYLRYFEIKQVSF